MNSLSYSLFLSFPQKNLAAAIANGFFPERNSAHEKRAKTSVKVKNSTLHLMVQSTDKSALRSSVLSAVELIDLSIRLASQKS